MKPLSIVLVLVVVLVLETLAGGAEVELRLVAHDQPDLTVDKLERQRPITNIVPTERGMETVKVGLDLVCWARNVLLDGEPVFERYHEKKYIGRVPVARATLKPGPHTLWPGDHVFTVDKDGKVATADPELAVDGQVVRIKCYPVTVRAFRANPDEGDLPMTMRVTPLPDLTIREADDHEKNVPTKKGESSKARELLPVFDKFAPLTIWLPANKAGKGYIAHPLGLTFHLGPEGVKPGAGGGQSVEGLRVERGTIEVPLYGFPVEGPVGGKLVVPGVEQFVWGGHDKGRKFLTNWYPRQHPYSIQLSEEGPTLEVSGDLRALPFKSLRMDVPDKAAGVPRVVVVESATRHLSPGGTLNARVRAADASALIVAPGFAQLRPYDGSQWTDLKLEAGQDGGVKVAIGEVPDGVYRLRLGIPSLFTDQWVSVTRKRPVGLGLFTQRGRDAFFRGEAFWIGLGIISIGGTGILPVGSPVEADLVDSTGRRLPLLREKAAKAIERRESFIIRVDAAASRALAPGRCRVEAKVGEHAARPLALDIVDPTPRTHFANVLYGKYNVMGEQYQRVLRTGEGAEELAREIAAMGYNTFIGMAYDISRVSRRDADLEQLVRERPELGPAESYYQPSGRDRFLNACVRHNLAFYENVFTYNDTMLPREPKTLDACERYISLETAAVRHSPALKGLCLYDEFYDTADTGTAMSQIFLKAQEVAFREKHKGTASADALKALDRFVGRPASQRRPEDLAAFRAWAEHMDAYWRDFSARMSAAAKAVMPAARNLTLQRFWGGNGGNIAPNGTPDDAFAGLDIAACVMYKDGGYGDRPVFAPMQADVMRVRDGLPVWTQLHTFGSPPLFNDHILRQAFFALSQKVDGLAFFTIPHDYEHPQAIDNRDVVRDITDKLCTRYGDLFTKLQRGHRKVAVYYSRQADHLASRKPENLSCACEGLWVACTRAGFPADFLYDQQIREGRGMDYEVVFAPGFTIEGETPPDLLAALARLVNAGKTVAVERASKLPIEGIVRLDSDLDEYDDKLGGSFPRNIDFEFESVFDQTEEMTRLVRAFLAKRIAPAAEHNLLVGPDWLRCGKAEYLVVSNFAPTRFAGLYKTLYQAPDTPTLRFPKRPPVCYDVLEMKRTEVRTDSATMTLQADLRHYPGKIYAFLPAEIGSVALAAPAAVAAGSDLNYQVTIQDKSGAAIDAGFPLEVSLVPPAPQASGPPIFRAAAPEHRGTIPLPANVPAGTWKLRVRELISGAAAEAAIEVKPGKAPAATLDARTVWAGDAERIREFLAAKGPVTIAVDDEQPWVRPHAEALARALAARGRAAKVAPVSQAIRLPADWDDQAPTLDGARLWRGNLVDPGLFVDAPLILLGKRFENRLIEALVRRDVLATPVSASFPGPGRAVVAWVRRGFSNDHDTIAILANDGDGLSEGIGALWDAGRGTRDEVQKKPEAVGQSAPVTRHASRVTDSFRDMISREDLVRTIDVDAASGRALVGTNGFGHNLFCFGRDGKLLWKQFLPEHNVYFARWYDAGKRVVAATGRGFFVFLLDGADGRVLKRFAATEWPDFHGGFNTYQEGAINTEVQIAVNPPLRQILIGGRTGLIAVDFDGRKMWYRDKAEAIASYPAEAVQWAGAAFGKSAHVGDFALSPDGSRLAHGEYQVCGSTRLDPEHIANVWRYVPMLLDARTGAVLAENTDDPGNQVNPSGWHTAWPAHSPTPWIHTQGLAFPLLADGKRGPLVSFDGRWLKDGGRLVMKPTCVERFAPDGKSLWTAASDRIFVPGLDCVSSDEMRLYRCDRDGLIKCVDLATGRALWEHKLPFPATLCATADGLVAGAQNGAAVRLDANGKVVWQSRLREHHEVPGSDYPDYIRAALARDPDSTAELFPVGEDKPGEYDGVLRMGIEQLAKKWKEFRFAPGQLGTRSLQRKVVPSATYLLEFRYCVEDRNTRLVAGALLKGAKETLTASKFAGRPGEWAFGRLAVKTLADTQAIEVGFEAEGGAVLVDDASFRTIRFPSANLLANAELHAVEPTFVRDIRVQYSRIPPSLEEKLRSRNRVAVLKQGLVSSATRFTQEQAFLHNGRLDDIGPVWFYQPDDAGFSIVLTRAAWVSHLVLYLNNATPDNAYRTISILANDMEKRIPVAVALVRGNRRRFVVVHFPKLLHTDSLKVLPGLHGSRKECLTEIEVYGPPGGPEMAGAGKRFADEPEATPMFMGAPSHVPGKLPADLAGEFVELGRVRIGAPAYNVSGTVAGGAFAYGEAGGTIRSLQVKEPDAPRGGDPKSEIRNPKWKGEAGPAWAIGTVTPTTTPARYAGRLIVGTADGKLHAVADNGMRLWSYQTGGRVYSAPVPDGDEVYFGSDDGRLYKLDVDSGILLWEFPTGGRIRSAPALAGGLVFFASWDGFLYAVDADKGTLAWKAQVARFTRSSPAVLVGGASPPRVFIGDEDGRMHCFEAASGKPLWSADLGGTISTCPAVAADGVLFANDQGDAALVAHDGAVRWKRALGARVTGQPLATQSQAIVPTERGVLALRRADGQPDPRFVPPESPGKVISAVPCGDKLFLIAAQADVDFRNTPRTYVTYEGASIVWGPKLEKPSAK
ncbi:MAG: hypothetical protein FJ291_15250 [Planctomycetes bacterium]|nr:hypothetical protein [Planctomycetota bacterium]